MVSEADPIKKLKREFQFPSFFFLTFFKATFRVKLKYCPFYCRHGIQNGSQKPRQNQGTQAAE